MKGWRHVKRAVCVTNQRDLEWKESQLSFHLYPIIPYLSARYKRVFQSIYIPTASVRHQDSIPSRNVYVACFCLIMTVLMLELGILTQLLTRWLEMVRMLPRWLTLGHIWWHRRLWDHLVIEGCVDCKRIGGGDWGDSRHAARSKYDLFRGLNSPVV